MPFTDEQKAAFEQWISTHNARGACSACGSTRGWEVADDMISPFDIKITEPGKLSTEPSKLAMIALGCKDCKHIRLFAAAPILGL